MELNKNELNNEEEIENQNKEESTEEIEHKESGNNLEEGNLNEEDEFAKENEEEEFEIPSKSNKKRKKRITYITFDEKYDYNANYFYQELTIDELKEITLFIEKFLSEKLTDISILTNFFYKYPNIIKGNSEKIRQILDDSSEKYPNIHSYKILNDFIISEYFSPKPTICQCYFFPDGSNEYKVVNILRTCKKSLDIAIYTFTLESIAKAVIEVYNRGIPVRIICDNECEKKSTSKIKKLASVGIVCKTDNSCYYMHHKFAVIDNSVVVTGSFNWSSQAVNHNEENILFYENKNIAQKFTDEFNRLWNIFDNVINREEAINYIEEKERIKKDKIEKERKKIEKKKEREKILKQKEIEKIEKQKEKEEKMKENEIEKQKEKEEKLKQKEIQKLQKQKEKENLKIENQKENKKTNIRTSKKEKIVKSSIKTRAQYKKEMQIKENEDCQNQDN